MSTRPVKRQAKPAGKEKGKATRRTRRVVASRAAGPVVPKVEVTPEECCKLAEDLAYFNVCCFREAAPGEIRKDDIERAEKVIAATTRNSP